MLRRKKMTLFFIGIALIIVALLAGIWWYFAIFSRSCNPPLPQQVITVGKTQFNAEMAETMAERVCGLSGRSGLNEGDGMLFIFGSGNTQIFWMKDMTFALDMIWISGDKVVGFAQDVPPPPPGAQIWQLKLYASPSAVDKVLEVSAGTVAKDGIQIGDSVGGL